MTRTSKRNYKLSVLAIMAVYVALMLFEWPLVMHTQAIGWRVPLALLPTLPIILVIVLAARRVMHGDELEQRVQLIALGIAVGVVSVASIVGAFLAIAQIWHVDGGVLIWVFPALCLVYGVMHVALRRRLTGTWDFWGC